MVVSGAGRWGVRLEVHYRNDGEPFRVERHDGGFQAWVDEDGNIAHAPHNWGTGATPCVNLLRRERAAFRRSEKARLTRLAKD